MDNFTRRGFIGGIGAMPLLAGAAGGETMAAANPDPYSYVDPEMAAALKKFPQDPEPPSARNLMALRAGSANYIASDAPELQPRKMTIPGGLRAGAVSVLIFDPKPEAKNRPATVYIHGGGYITGRADTTLRLAQDAAKATDGLVVSVDYTLAPEAPFPQSLEQNYAAFAWLHRNAAEYGVDPARIAVLGDSAGGGHAAMLAIAARDRREFPLAFQCLIYPMLDDRTGSTRQVPPYMGHFLWTPAANRFGWSSLLGKPAGSSSVPPGSVPARLTDVSGLAPAFIGVGSIDLFCDEDIEYARRLAQAGVPTELFIVPGAYHGFDIVAPEARLTVQFEQVWKSALRRGLGLA